MERCGFGGEAQLGVLCDIISRECAAANSTKHGTDKAKGNNGNSGHAAALFTGALLLFLLVLLAVVVLGDSACACCGNKACVGVGSACGFGTYIMVLSAVRGKLAYGLGSGIFSIKSVFIEIAHNFFRALIIRFCRFI